VWLLVRQDVGQWLGYVMARVSAKMCMQVQYRYLKYVPP